ncbi:MAG: hypothetical protein AAF670_20210, partial [Planctomycetota bacterium]
NNASKRRLTKLRKLPIVAQSPWVRRYSLSVRKGCVQDLPINRQTAIRFSRTLLQCGAPAWQRWQAVRALACYRDLVLKRSEPDLSDVILTLARLGRSERNID